MRMRSAAVVAGLALGLMSGAAEAATYTVTFTQNAQGVFASGIGAFDTDVLARFVDGAVTPFVSPDPAGFGFGPTPGIGTQSDTYSGSFSGPNSIGKGGFTFADIATGDVAAFTVDRQFISVPTGYLSGSPLLSEIGFQGRTYADLGLKSGTYTYTYGVSEEALRFSADVFLPSTMSAIVINVSPVPLPASAPMFGAGLLGLAGLGYAAKRKKAAAAA